MRFIVLLIMVCFSLSAAAANFSQKLEGFLTKANVASNVSSGGSYHDQMGGFWTGGGLRTRAPIQEMRFANVQLPKFSAGCGGIDLFMGGFSYINSEQLKMLAENIMSNAGQFAFSLALKTALPQVESVMQQLEEAARFMNGLGINSCETAATLVGGMWPKSAAASDMVCASMGAENNRLTSYVAGKHSCSSDSNRSGILSESQNSSFKDMLIDDYNLVWEALNKNKAESNHSSAFKKERELMLSAVGTIISKSRSHNEEEDKAEDNRQIIYKPSLINDNFLEVMVYGSDLYDGKGGKSSASRDVQKYSCEDEKCLTLKQEPLRIPRNQALINKVANLIVSIENKIRREGSGDKVELSIEERNLIETTRLPIAKIINVQAAFGRSGAAMSAVNFADEIAFDIALTYLEDIVDRVSLALSHIEQLKLNPDDVRQIQRAASLKKQELMEKKQNLYQKIQAALEMVAQGQLLEKEVRRLNQRSYLVNG
jgi:conjugative transfer pilus assembly protein TraH